MSALTVELDVFLIILAVLLLTSLIASRIAVRFGIPALLLFAGIGMLIGSEGLGGIAFDNPRLTQDIGIVALIFILFSGGLDTNWNDIRPVWREGILLSTVGVALTSLAVGVFAHLALGFSLEAGILLGAVMSSTDAAAVFSVLRGKAVNLKGKLAPTLEIESGSNDPMAIFLTLGMIHLITQPNTHPLELIPAFIIQMGLGFVIGLLLGQVALLAINRFRLEYDGLYPVLTISFVLLLFGVATLIGGNGFLSVYIGAVVLAQNDFIHKNSLISFHDGIAWLVQITMFLTLGLQVFPSILVEIAPVGIVVAAFLIFVARPIGVYVALALLPVNSREKAFISWVGLRGAAPIILATFPVLAGIETPFPFYELVFFVVLTSVLLQGTTLVPVARRLRLYDRNAKRQSLIGQIMQGKALRNHIIEIVIPTNADVIGKQVLDLNLSSTTLIVLISRQNDVIVPNGGTILEANDHVLVLSAPDERHIVEDLFTRPPVPELI